jgi:hypothetical protein
MGCSLLCLIAVLRTQTDATAVEAATFGNKPKLATALEELFWHLSSRLLP